MTTARREELGGGEALAEALEHVAAGYKIGPVTIRLKSNGEKGVLFHTAWKEPGGISDDPEQVRAWVREHPGCGFHLPAGPNGIVVVDGDVKRDSQGRVVGNGVEEWQAAGGPSSAMTVTTRNGGKHWYFRAPDEPIASSANAIAGVPHVDVRGNRADRSGTVFISGTTVHGGGGTYAANRIVSPEDLPELSDRWAKRLRKAGPSVAKERPARERAAGDRAPRREGLVLASGFHAHAWIEAKALDALRQLGREGQGDFRARLFIAASFGFRAAGAGVLEESEVHARLADAIERVWHNEPDSDDRRWIREAQLEAERTPWHVELEIDPDVPDPEPGDEPIELVDPETGEEKTPEQLAQERYDRDLEHELRRERLKRDVARRLAAEEAPALRLLGLREFLDAPRPEPIVPGVFYADSLSRIYGAPGCGKSFVALDLACHVALGRDWRDEEVQQGPVVYVMAEGQAVNVLRTEAWCERNKTDPAELEGRLFAVPDAVQLTDEGVRELVAAVAELRPRLIVLDTKNAMMVGEENSATDTATMRRALDALRKASGACVVLIDHTGYEGTRARGSSAATAAMDTELRVTKGDGSPPLITTEVTRDKAAEVGREWRWHLRMAADAAALVPTELDGDAQAVDRSEPAWKTADGVMVPQELLDYAGRGSVVMPELARFLAHDASPRHGDAAGIGVSRAEAIAAMKREGFEPTGVRRAWSFLLEKSYLDPAGEKTTETGRHVWAL